MDSNQKILLVTGSNKGIGFAILDGLLKEKTKLKLILTIMKKYYHLFLHLLLN